MSIASPRLDSGAVPATFPQPAAKETPLSIEKIVAGRFYKINLIFPTSNDSSPTEVGTGPPLFITDQRTKWGRDAQLAAVEQELDHPRIALAVGCKAGAVTVLVCSSSVRSSYKGNERRWIPVDASTSFPKQPPLRAITDPSNALIAYTVRPHLCYTHAVVVSPVQRGGPMDWAGNAHFMQADSITDQTLPPANVVDNDATLIGCTNVDDVLEAHVDYWNGIRYDYRGNRVVSGSGGDKSGSGGTAGGKSGSIGKSGICKNGSQE